MNTNQALNGRGHATVRSHPDDSEAVRWDNAGFLKNVIQALDELIHFDDLELEITTADIEADLRQGRD